MRYFLPHQLEENLVEAKEQAFHFCEKKTRPEMTFDGDGETSRKRKRNNYFKDYYTNLTQEERNSYINRSIENRRESSLGALNDHHSPAKRRVKWLLRATQSEYQFQGNTFYNPSCSELHQMKVVPHCIHCGAKKFEHEVPTFCCDNERIKLASTHVHPTLYSLFKSNTTKAIEFRKNIRKYNNLFSFTSFGATIDKSLASSTNGVYTFRAQGQIYHHLPGLIPNTDKPAFFQLYFHDCDNELHNRMKILQNNIIDEGVMKMVMEILKDNPYAIFLRSLRDLESFKDIRVCIATNTNLDQRVYKTPTSNEVVAIWIEGNNSNVPFEREIVIHEHSGQRHYVKHYYGCYDPLQYPLLFPKGESGWHQNIIKIDCSISKQNNNSSQFRFSSVQELLQQEQTGVTMPKQSHVSCREYYCYKLQIRESEPSVILLTGRLLQQFVVDMYIKLETTRLDYFRNKQSEIRAEVY
ncbi:uncharacterized protein LOC109821181 [Asparagus officinalis]|uniref:uncharacterized protein LOC109821181 n=1 Tax=Asparagus officinalis TaxID=4686 RepID=UPI00098DF9D5|nr:uncharacterized protein LOC109821181 [Asparagus officinalis]